MGAGRLIFEKRQGKYDALFVESDGMLKEIPCPKQAPIPHDMFHYAVETVLSLRGFASRVAQGEGADYRMTPEAQSESVERLVEVMQADSWSGRPDPAEVLALYKTTCAARGATALAIDRDDINAVRAEIDRLSEEWAALPVRARMVLEI